MAAPYSHELFQSANHINKNIQPSKALSNERMSESATAVLLSGSITTPAHLPSFLHQQQQQQSIVLDNGEYYYDDDFSVPFDANLREENNNVGGMDESSSGGESSSKRSPTNLVSSTSNSIGGMVQSRSDVCLYGHAAGVEEIGKHTAPRVMNLPSSSDIDDYEEENSEVAVTDDHQLFTPPSCSDILLGGKMTNSSIELSASGLRSLLQRHYQRDYKLAFESPGSTESSPKHVAGQSEGGQQQVPNGLQRSVSNTSVSSGATSSLSSWAALAAGRKRPGQPEVEPARQTKPTTSQPAPTTSWRNVKRVASNDMTTWNQLKGAVKTTNKSNMPLSKTITLGESEAVVERRGRSIARNLSATGKDEGASSFSNRSRSEPPDKRDNMHRFSGTLLEIFMRERTNPCSPSATSTTEDTTQSGTGTTNARVDVGVGMPPSWAPALTPRANHLLGISPSEDTGSRGQGSTRRWFNQLFSANCLSSSGGEQRVAGDSSATSSCFEMEPGSVGGRAVRNFGAQFPAADAATITSANSVQQTGSPIRRSSSAAAYGMTNSMSAVDGARVRSSSVMAGRTGPAISYPGLGMLAVPKPSRLAASAFLSRTLPDLSFLRNVATPEATSSTRLSTSLTGPRKAKHKADCCQQCGCSVQTGEPPVTNDLIKLDEEGSPHKSGSGVGAQTISKFSSVPDILSQPLDEFLQESKQQTTHQLEPENRQAQQLQPPLIPVAPCSPVRKFASEDQLGSASRDSASTPTERPLKSCLRRSTLDRSTSEPDMSSAAVANSNQGASTMGPGGGDSSVLTSSAEWTDSETPTGAATPTTGAGQAGYDKRPKKSVSFSGKILLHIPSGGGGDSPVVRPRPTSELPAGDMDRRRPHSLVYDCKVIPRDWGLYGLDAAPLAEFSSSPTNSPVKEEHKTDEDRRYDALVNDVIKAVKEMEANLLRLANSTSTTSSQMSGDDTTVSNAANTTSTTMEGGITPLFGPLVTLITDGLLPLSKQLFSNKPRTRLWHMVEDSCRPGTANRVLAEACTQVKNLTGALTEKAKFRAFVCSCLNHKALPMWVNSVVSQEELLRKHYCEDAFLRRCRTSQRVLHADLLTNLERLLYFNFALDLTSELRVRPPGQQQRPPLRARHDIRTGTHTNQQTHEQSKTTPAVPAANSNQVQASAGAPRLAANSSNTSTSSTPARPANNASGVTAPPPSNTEPTLGRTPFATKGRTLIRSAFSSIRQRATGSTPPNATTGNAVQGQTSRIPAPITGRVGVRPAAAAPGGRTPGTAASAGGNINTTSASSSNTSSRSAQFV